MRHLTSWGGVITSAVQHKQASYYTATGRMATHCCLCDQLPNRKKKFHGSSCIPAKSALTFLSTVPLESIAAMKGPDAVLCSNCEQAINNISHYQSKVDSLKKKCSLQQSPLLPGRDLVLLLAKSNHNDLAWKPFHIQKMNP